MKSKKKSNGITLIALIITIIVLIILAIVAIRAVNNDGILKYAKKAQTMSKDGQEQKQLLEYEYRIAKAQGMAGSYDEYVLEKSYGAKVGDYVNYDCYTGVESSLLTVNVNNITFNIQESDSNLEWVILGINEGKILITTKEPTKRLSVSWGNGTTTIYNQLVNVSAMYGHGKGAQSGKCLTIEDVNKIMGYVPKESQNICKYKMVDGTVQYSKSIDYGKTWSSYEATSISRATYFDNETRSFKSLNDLNENEERQFTPVHYSYSLGTSNAEQVLKCSNKYFIATPYILNLGDKNGITYDGLYVVSDNVSSMGLTASSMGDYIPSGYLRPVVTLLPNATLNANGNQTHSTSETAWVIE